MPDADKTREQLLSELQELRAQVAILKNVEAALRESEGKYRDLVENVNDIVWQTNEKFVFTYISPQIFNAWGYTPEEVVGKAMMDFMPPDEAERVSKTLKDMAGKRDKLLMYENRHLRKDGRIMFSEVSGQPIIDGNGVYRGYRGVARDITERKRAEEALKFERLQLLSIFDSIDEVIYIADPYTYEILYANKAMQDKFGKSLTGGVCYREIQDKDAPCEFCTNDIILRNKGEPYQWEFHNPTVNKDFGIVDRIIKWPDGRDVRFEIALDITERKRAEDALRESEEKYRELVENANSIIIRWDMQGNLTFFNEFAEMLFGYSKNEILGRNVVGTIVPLSESTGRDLDDMIEDVKRYPERYKLNVNENMCKNGDRVWIAWTNKAIHDEHGNVVEILSVGNDITERKRAEEELESAKDQLAAELDAMDRLHAISVQFVLNGDLSAVLKDIINAAVAITNADMGNIQILDPESGRLKIVAQRGFERPFLDYFDSVPEGRAACGTAMMRMERVVVEDVSRSPIFVGTPELEVMLAAGVRAVQSTPLLSRSGRLLGMFSTHYRTSRRPDERELKLIDLLVRQTADIIERTLAEKQLVDSKAQAELYLDLMGHDINNLHQVALGYLELARDMPAGEEQAVFLDKPVEVLQRSAKLISNVRKLQKLHDGMFQDQDVDVGKVLSDVQREFGAVPDKTITLSLNGFERCHVRANELLHDVFANLVGNAIKHTGDRADIVVDLDIVKDNGGRYCRVAVEDDGPGIPDDFKGLIFDRALKGTAKAKGMGLGLYLVKSLVDSYGGRVWVEDRIMGDHKKGARFVVVLPAAEK